MNNAAVLITGCSTGVGAAAARQFLALGHPVYATARQPESLEDLAAAGAVTMALDVLSDDSITAAVKRVEADHGAVGVLVNNAAYGIQGAMETADLDAIRTMFDTNLFGLARTAQLALPAMRARRTGRIINISSMGGHFSLPGAGFLHATKHAVEAVSDAQRLELKPFGIHVAIVEPGPIRSAFHGKINATLPSAPDSGPYADFHEAVRTRIERAYEPRPWNLVLEPDDVAKAILRAATARRPRARYPVGLMAHGTKVLTRILPDSGIDGLTRLLFPVPRQQD
ncbi:oxidoreductase [Kineosporia mesophila]|uniref:Oxidoreductase n=1 Tax=Kineosporia mesophila TaxID=566012 RepID=A0ABP6Z729_9ACTN|nr:SDR family NAD(P)-dependent oxidoreductase [Kineosporia mesophila]MCD5352979.1 SDR family NAD(P)-dependent oxidoreductase [Kineosporia mesophila]